MDDDVEMEIEQPLLGAYEVDVDYEFDAVRWFDFTREETRDEARSAEAWFEFAHSYPPSPFVRSMLLREEVLADNGCSSPKSEDGENMTTLVDDDSDTQVMGHVLSTVNVNKGMLGGIFSNLRSDLLQYSQNPPLGSISGSLFYNSKSTSKLNTETKSSVKKSFPRSSTLMKPTASHLAKQNRSGQVGGFRSHTSKVRNEVKSLCNAPVVESQAPKRQKLEGGCLYKQVDATIQQKNLVHKAPKMTDVSGTSSVNAKTRITIPMAPDLETKQRAQRLRPKSGARPDHVTYTVRHFKARPLNRKILEAPSLPVPKKSTPKLPDFRVFHFKTQERALQHASTVSSSTHHCNDSEKDDKTSCGSLAEDYCYETRRPITPAAQKQNRGDTSHNFKARPLNRKIFASKGDLGIFRNTKRKTTVPMEFNFHSEKRVQTNPPVDLFSKLSLRSEPQPSSGSQLQTPQPTSIHLKGPKENRVISFEPQNESTCLVKEKPSTFGAEVGNYLRARNLGLH